MKKKEYTATEEKETEEKADDEETESETEEETEEETEGETEEETESEKEEDWKKIAEDERLKREKAEKALATKRFYAKRKDTKEDEDEDDDDNENKALTASELRAILAEDRRENQKEFLSSRVKEVAKSLADSDDEANAITAIFNNRIFPASMTLEEQVKEAYFIAHGPRLLAKRDELRRSLRGKDGKKKSGAEDTHRDQSQVGEPKISPQDKAEFNRLGFKWDGKNYSKKLANGKFLIKDWKTKKVFVK